MNKPHVNFEEYVAKMENSHSNKAIIIPYIKGGNVVDFGAGTGKLAEMIKAVKPTYRITAVENDSSMRERLQTAVGVDQVVERLEEITEPINTIIFNSVLHEVESYSVAPLALNKSPKLPRVEGDLFDLLKNAASLLNNKDRIIIRDGFLDDSSKEMSVRVLDTSFDVDYYLDNYMYYHQLQRAGNRVSGPFNDVKEFLNKLTWGMESLPREIYEKINFLTKEEWTRLLSLAGFNIITLKTYTQPSYFYYLQKVAEIDQIWDTHILIVAERQR